MKFKWLCCEAGFNSDDELASFFNVTVKTVRNWQKKEAPFSVICCLELMSGRLDLLGSEWKGFRLTKDAIFSPEGDHLFPYEVRALKYLYSSSGIERRVLVSV